MVATFVDGGTNLLSAGALKLHEQLHQVVVRDAGCRAHLARDLDLEKRVRLPRDPPIRGGAQPRVLQVHEEADILEVQASGSTIVAAGSALQRRAAHHGRVGEGLLPARHLGVVERAPTPKRADAEDCRRITRGNHECVPCGEPFRTLVALVEHRVGSPSGNCEARAHKHLAEGSDPGSDLDHGAEAPLR